ncbi:motility associated factor glycosyltransferase family protein [Paramagnetospirillum kuznetsovii]|nr:6-hydroxymethylpterin diphosphokinase MptE-like protein [Paramagnetospirillum kuznetsovii]
MKPYQNLDRFRLNLRALSKRDPALARCLETAKPSTRLVIGDNGELNVDLGGGSLVYPDGARSTGLRQVSTYLEEPLRLFVDPGEVSEDCVELNRLIRTMAEGMADGPKAEKPGPFGGYVVVFGAGLGYHLQALADKLRFKTMIVVEPHDDFLVHTLHSIDWQVLFQSLGREGRDIRFVRGGDAFSKVIEIMRGPNYPLINGSYFYFHYQSPELSALGQRLLVNCKDLAMVAGWVEDQVRMLRNNTANFSRKSFHVQRSSVSTPRACPAIVVGAGPSIDQGIEHIRRLRDQAIVISTSSGLRILLENGIRPDIHCELENIVEMGGLAEQINDQHGLSDIVLYASPTVDPRVPPLYKQAAYFFRKDVSSSRLYAKGAATTSLAEPTSGNTAIYAALSLGFREIYLFGMDFGAKDPSRHHSKDSIYFREDGQQFLTSWRPYALDTLVPGNFGGQVYSGWLMDWGRNAAANAIRTFPGVRVINCSDGSLIPCTTPLRPDAIDLPAPALSRDEEIQSALGGLAYAPDGLADPDGLAELRRIFHQTLDRCRKAMADLASSQQSSQDAAVTLCDRVVAELISLEASSGTAFGTLIGHLQTALCETFNYASVMAPHAEKPGLSALSDALVEGIDRLYPLIDDLFGPHPP